MKAILLRRPSDPSALEDKWPSVATAVEDQRRLLDDSDT